MPKEESIKMKKNKLTDKDKLLIQNYLRKFILPLGLSFSIISGIVGYLINDLARESAYNKAYSEAAQIIMHLTSDATKSATKINELEKDIIKLTKESESVLIEASQLNDKIKKTLVIQQADEIVSSVTENLTNDTNFQKKVTQNINRKLINLENKTSVFKIDQYGNVLFKNEIHAKNFVLSKSKD